MIYIFSKFILTTQANNNAMNNIGAAWLHISLKAIF